MEKSPSIEEYANQLITTAKDNGYGGYGILLSCGCPPAKPIWNPSLHVWEVDCWKQCFE